MANEGKKKKKSGQQLSMLRWTECFHHWWNFTFQQKQQSKSIIAELGRYAKWSSTAGQKTQAQIHAIENTHNVLIVQFQSLKDKLTALEEVFSQLFPLATGFKTRLVTWEKKNIYIYLIYSSKLLTFDFRSK